MGPLIRPAAWVPLLLACIQSAQANFTNPYIVDADNTVVAQATDAMAAFCGSSPQDPSQEWDDYAKYVLSSNLGDDNPLLTILEESTSRSDMQSKAAKEFSPGYILSKAAGTITAIILAFVWFWCCWSACPCCKCCRCCGKKQRCHIAAKIFVILAVLGLLVGIIVACVYASNGMKIASAGFASVGCQTSTLVKTTLAGQDPGVNNSFIGLMGVLTQFNNLDQMLNDGSDFLAGLNTVLDQTQVVSQASTVAAETLNLLKTVLSAPENVRPKDAAGVWFMYDCQFCTGVASTLDPAISALQNGVANALAGAREEVADQLSPASRASLQDALRQNVQPIKAFKDMLRDTFKPLVNKDNIDSINNVLKQDVIIVVLVLFLLAFLIVLCSLSSSVWCSVREVAEEDENSKDQKINPHYKGIHRCACCAWCCGFLQAFLAFLIGGILTGIGVPLSSACLILDELDVPTLKSIAKAMEMNITGDAGAMQLSLMDGCVLTRDANRNANFLDILYVPTPQGNKTYLRKRIVDDVKAPIIAAFDLIGQASSGQSISIANSPGITSLRKLFRDNDIRGLMLANAVEMNKSGLLVDLARDPDGVAVGYGSSAYCSNLTVSGSVGSLGGTTVPGIDNFVDKLELLGSDQVSVGSCGWKVDCTGNALGSNARRACESGNNFIDNWGRMEAATTYRCDLFQDPVNPTQYCDPLGMTKSGSSWINDCMLPDGSLRQKPKTCDLATFARYIQDYDLRIKKVMERLDTSATSTLDGINVQMRGLVQTNIISVVDAVANGLYCGFMPVLYRKTVTGLCWQGVYGIALIAYSYIVSAALVLSITFVMYILWRIAIDNVNFWEKDNKPSITSVVPVTPADMK